MGLDYFQHIHENGLDYFWICHENGQMKTIKRYLFSDLIQLALKRNKMAFISGPRQVGKTTLAKQLMRNYDQAIYKNWDETEFRRLWTKSPNSIAESFEAEKFADTKLLVLDEIHKSKSWKQKVKGIYDTHGNDLNIAVTGSARLNIFTKGGDSLMGRYLNFRLHPLSFGEVTSKEAPFSPEQWKKKILKKPTAKATLLDHKKLHRLIEFSGFPEPYLVQDKKILNLWRRGRIEKLVREDIRDLSRLPELSRVEMLASLLPTKVGSPLSVQSLREDLEVAHDTVSRWLKYLNHLYYFFELKPWSNSIVRSIKKEPKIYLYDWTEVDNWGTRLENILAAHLYKACNYWVDTGEGHFELYYLRNKEKEEIDFLIVQNKKPWLAIECKSKEGPPDKKIFDKYQKQINCPIVQVNFEQNNWREFSQGQFIISADLFLSGLA